VHQIMDLLLGSVATSSMKCSALNVFTILIEPRVHTKAQTS
jgi:hypothetical protein